MDEVKVPVRVAHCGLNCSTCQIFVATRENDPERKKSLRAEIAATIRERYGKQMFADQVNDCDGCRSDTGRLYSGCLECEIRKCAIDNRIESCAFCVDYPCDKLHRFFLSEAVDQGSAEA